MKLLWLAQNYTITTTTNLAVNVRARLAIINPIAVANVEARLGAVPPDRALNEPRKRLRKTWIELLSIDPLRHGIYNVGATASPVAGCAIRMVGIEPFQDAGADQKIVHQGVDGNHAAADLCQRCRRFGAPSKMDERLMVRTLSETP